MAAPALWALGLAVLPIKAERIAVLFRIADYTRPGVADAPQRRSELV